MLTRVGTMAMPCAANASMRLRHQPAGVLDAVGPRGGEVVEALLPEAVGRHPGALLVGGRDRLGEDVGRPARGEVTGVAVDPVADELDPAVAGPGLGTHLVDEAVGLHLPGEAADVAPGAGDVPAGPDDLRQVGAVVDPPGVEGEPASRMRRVPASRSVSGLGLGGRGVGAPLATSPTWQCASTSPGSTQPPRVSPRGRRPAARRSAAHRRPRPRAGPPRGRRGGVR